jgi:hypothetical protein
MPPISRAKPELNSETLRSETEIRLRSKSRKRDPTESEEANPGVRIINPSRTKRRITARSKSKSGSPEVASQITEEAADNGDDAWWREVDGGSGLPEGGTRMLKGGTRLLGGGAELSGGGAGLLGGGARLLGGDVIPHSVWYSRDSGI